jgi:hypothetical protein
VVLPVHQRHLLGVGASTKNGRQPKGHIMPASPECMAAATHARYLMWHCHRVLCCPLPPPAAGSLKVTMFAHPVATLGLLLLVFVMVTEMPRTSAAMRTRVLMQEPPVEDTCTSTCAELCTNCMSDDDGKTYGQCEPPNCARMVFVDSTGSATSKCSSLVDPATNRRCPCTLCQELSG